MALTASYHVGKGRAKHNDLSFTDKTYSYQEKGNIYVVNGNVEQLKNEGFEVCEKKIYEMLFKEHIVCQNARNDINRHSERNKTLDSYYDANQPSEVVYQIGNMLDNVQRNDLMRAYNIYHQKLDDWNARTGNHVAMLDYALHCHEAGGNHIHERNIYIAIDRDGNYEMNMTKALEQAGLERPDTSEKTSRYNNVKMTYDNMCRDMWLESCKEVGLEMFDDYDHTGNKKHQNVRNYKILQEKALKAREKALNDRETLLNEREDNLNAEVEKRVKTQNMRLEEQYKAKEDEIGDLLWELRDVKNQNLQQRRQAVKSRYEDIIQDELSQDKDF